MDTKYPAIGLITCLVVVTLSAEAVAGPVWLEMGDAGRDTSTAQSTSGNGNMDGISGGTGSAASGTDFIDMYLINICDPQCFRATTLPPGSSSFNPQLWLFKPEPIDPLLALGLLGNKDAAGTEEAQLIPIPDDGQPALVEPGLYYLAISGFDAVPLAGNQPIFDFISPEEVSGPDGGGGGGPFDDWTEGGETGTYLIALEGVRFADSPCCPGDLDFDGDVGVVDLLVLLGTWGPCKVEPCAADINNDGFVDVLDLLILLAGWGPCQQQFPPCCDEDKLDEGEPDCGLPVDTVNTGCNGDPPIFSPLQLGEGYCSSGAFDGVTRDTDWYETVVETPLQMTWTVRTGPDLQASIGVVSTVPPGSGDCADVTGLNPVTTVAPNSIGVITLCLPAGVHWFFVAAEFDGDIVKCPAEYNISLDAVACDEPPECNDPMTCQIPDQLAHGSGNTLAVTSDLNPNAGFKAADNFIPVSDGFVSDLCWWGIYLEFKALVDCGPGPGDAFTVTYYQDAGGLPGLIYAGPHLVALTAKYATGRTLNSAIGPIAEYHFQGTHMPVAVSGGQCLWLEITNNTNGNCFWLWQAAPAGDNLSAQDLDLSGAYEPGEEQDFDLAFCTDIPIPADGCQSAGSGPCDGATGPCCMPNRSPGCDHPPCCSMVCKTNPFCCEVMWDPICADQANDLCAICNPAVVPGQLPGTSTVEGGHPATAITVQPDSN